MPYIDTVGSHGHDDHRATGCTYDNMDIFESETTGPEKKVGETLGQIVEHQNL